MKSQKWLADSIKNLSYHKREKTDIEMMNDLDSRVDIEKLVNLFYEKVRKDPLLAPVFQHVDWPAHLPVMYNFWSSLLLGDQSYQGNPFQKHIHLGITASHFAQWLKLFLQTVDENFAGLHANEVKSRAQSIAGVWQYKMGLIK